MVGIDKFLPKFDEIKSVHRILKIFLKSRLKRFYCNLE